jgi:thiol-disulfide isomerase/thioredoxin
MGSTTKTTAHCRDGQRWRRLALGLGIALVVCVWFFREPLRKRIFAQAVLANDAPSDELVQEMIQNATDGPSAVLAAWNTAKIAQRRSALQNLSGVVHPGQPLPSALRAMVLAAALDPDLDAREIALSALDERNDPALAPLSGAQLNDLDPEVRLLGLMHLKKVPARVGVPMVVPLLNDKNPEILAYAVKLLENWSGEKFGVKLGDAVPVEDAGTGLIKFDDASYSKTRAGADRAASWWEKHKAEFHPIDLDIPSEALPAPRPVYASDFTLPGLDGKVVRLADFRGKVVLINFWTTWCTACISEIPELIALQKNHHDGLALLGVSLDFVPNEDNPEPPLSREAIRNKIARTATLRGISYRILLDEKNAVGGRFNGGELPTTVIIDAQGRIRRRFVGARSLSVFEAMVAEASKPVPPIQASQQEVHLNQD